jgi:glycosyltransferase involved in cell wall biosynthesis
VRVLHVITRLELGGAQQNTLFTCRRLAEQGLDVTLASGPGGLLDDEAAAGPYRHVVVRSLVREIRPARDLAALVALTRLVHRLRPDVVHTHSSKAGALGRLAARLGGAGAVVHTVHGWSFSDLQPLLARTLYRTIERAARPLTDHVVSVSRLDLEAGRRLGLVPEGRGSVIRSGIDLAELDPDGPGRDDVRAEWGVGDGEVLVVNVSCLKPQKAPLDFVRAAGRAARDEPSLRFALVGDGELRPAVEAAAAEEGLGARLVLAGWRRDVPRILRAADVVALTSLWEGLPRAVVQARVCGRPVVATAVNGTPEAVVPDRTGFLVAPHDVAGLAARFVQLARDGSLRRRLSEGARASGDFRREFDQEEMVRLQLELYGRLTGRA